LNSKKNKTESKDKISMMIFQEINNKKEKTNSLLVEIIRELIKIKIAIAENMEELVSRTDSLKSIDKIAKIMTELQITTIKDQIATEILENTLTEKEKEMWKEKTKELTQELQSGGKEEEHSSNFIDFTV